MNEPEDLQFCHKIRLKAYPTVELGGLVWAYMGLALVVVVSNAA